MKYEKFQTYKALFTLTSPSLTSEVSSQSQVKTQWSFSYRFHHLDILLQQTILQSWYGYTRQSNLLFTSLSNLREEIHELNRVMEGLYFQGIMEDWSMVLDVSHCKKFTSKAYESFLTHDYFSLFFALHSARITLTLLRNRCHYLTLPDSYRLFLDSMLPLFILDENDFRPTQPGQFKWNWYYELAQYAHFEVDTLLLLLDTENPDHRQELYSLMESLDYYLQEVKNACYYAHELHLFDCIRCLRQTVQRISSYSLFHSIQHKSSQ